MEEKIVHPDEAAVDRFAAKMREKLAQARADGRHGWDDPDVCSTESLCKKLINHVGRGDPVDVANFCMMLSERGVAGNGSELSKAYMRREEAIASYTRPAQALSGYCVEVDWDGLKSECLDEARSFADGFAFDFDNIKSSISSCLKTRTVEEVRAEAVGTLEAALRKFPQFDNDDPITAEAVAKAASDGEIHQGSQGEIMVGLRGIVGAMYLKDLADKTRRGLEGVARSGRIPGGLCYGYRPVPGETRGLREIDEAEAGIVRRIYAEYDAGQSPRAIIKALIADGIPGPRGRAWGVSTLLGNAKRLNGILCNPLYKGELVFNRQRKVKNPETGKAKMVPNPPDQWQRYDHPDLAIVDRALWERVHARRLAGAETRPEYQRRPRRVLSGLVRCGVCGGPVRTIGPNGRQGCANRRDKATCSNKRSILASDLEHRVFDGIRAHLLAPDLIEYAVECYRERMEELDAGKAQARARLEKEIAAAERSVSMAKAMVRRGEMPAAWLCDAATEAEQALPALKAQLDDIDGPNVVQLHPQAAGQYKRLVQDLTATLDSAPDSPARAEAVSALRSLITSINVLPGQKRGEVHIEIEGDLAALLGIKEGGEGVGAMGAGGRFGRSCTSIIPYRFAAG